VLTLTLGIGATASMFSVTDGVFNRPPPGVPDDPALVMIRGIEVDRDGARGRLMSWPEVVQYTALTDLVVAQIALTQPLLVGLAVMTAVAVRGVRPQPGSAVGDRVVIAEFKPYAGTLARAADPMPSIIRRLSGLPGVMAVVPERTGLGPMTLEVAGDGSTSRAVFKVRLQSVPPAHFRALDIPVALGREFAPADTFPGAPLRVIIGTDAAKRVFGSVNPIGQRLYRLSKNGPSVGDGQMLETGNPSLYLGRSELEIVGVVASEQIGAHDDDEQLRVFIPSTNL